MNPSICQGRLSQSSDPLQPQTWGPNLYFVPYCGNLIGLWDATNGWELFPIQPSGIPANPLIQFNGGASTYFSNFDVFASKPVSPNPMVVLSKVQWTDDKTRAEPISQFDGILVKTSDPSQRYLGTVRTWNDGYLGRFGSGPNIQNCIYNYYNRVPRPIRSAASFTNSYASATPRVIANSDVATALIVVGVEDDMLVGSAGVFGRGDGGDYHVGIRVTNDLSTLIDTPQGNVSLPRASYSAVARADVPKTFLKPGLNHIQIIEYAYGGTGYSSDAGLNLSFRS